MPTRPARAPAAALAATLLAALALAACDGGGGGDGDGAVEVRGSAPAGPAHPRADSLVIFTVDTLRADWLGPFGGRGGPTPHVDRLAAEGVAFERAYTQATITNPALTSMLTGLTPRETKVHTQTGGYAEGILPLAALARAGGVATGSFVANLCRLQDVPGTVFSEGWDARFCGMLDDPRDYRDQHHWDAAVVDAGLAWIAEQDGPFLAWIHLMDPHAEHRPSPEDWDWAADPPRERFAQYEHYDGFERRREAPSAAERDRLWALYAAEVRGADRELGRVLAALDARADRGRVALLFSADHGEELFETWVRYDHGLSATEGVLRVPLVVRAPGLAPRREERPVELLQVTPTALALLGLEPPYPLDGPSLLDAEPSRGVARSYVSTIVTTVRAPGWRFWQRHTRAPYTRPPDQAPWRAEAPWFERRQSLARYGADGLPEWVEPRDAEAGLVAKLRRPILDERRAPPRFGEPTRIDDPALREQLRNLGYAEDEVDAPAEPEPAEDADDADDAEGDAGG